LGLRLEHTLNKFDWLEPGRGLRLVFKVDAKFRGRRRKLNLSLVKLKPRKIKKNEADLR